MGRGLGGDAGSAALRATNDVDGKLRGNVLQVDVRAGVFGEDDVAGHDHVLGGIGPSAQAQAGGDHALVHHRALRHRIILAVIHHRQIEHAGVLDRPPHEIVGLHAFAVVGDRDHAGALEGANRRQRLALHADGDAAGRVHPHDGVAGGGVLDELDGAGVVRDRGRVRHANHGGEPAGGGGARPGCNGLLVGLAGLAEVDVDVDQPGAGDEATGVEDARTFLRRGGQRSDKPAVADEEVAGRVALGGGVDDAGVLDPEGGHGGIRRRGRRVPAGRRRRGKARPCAQRCRWSPARG